MSAKLLADNQYGSFKQQGCLRASSNVTIEYIQLRDATKHDDCGFVSENFVIEVICMYIFNKTITQC